MDSTEASIEDNTNTIQQLILEGHYAKALEESSKNLENGSILNNFKLVSQQYVYCALAYYKMSCFEEALKDATQALEIVKKANKEFEITKIKILLLLGKVHMSKADYKESLNMLIKGLSMLNNAKSIDSAQYYCSLGKLYTEIGEYAEATKHLDECSRILSKNIWHKEYNLELISYYCTLGKLYEYQLKLEASEDSYTKAYNILTGMYSKNHPELFSIYCGLGNVCFGQNNSTKALEWYVKALEIAQKNFPDNHLTCSVCYYSFGNVYLQKNLYQTAEQFYSHSLSIKNKYFHNTQHPDLAKLKFNLCTVYIYQRNPTKALELLEEAEHIFIEKLSPDHALIVSCLHNKAKIFEMQGKLGLALEAFQQVLAKYRLGFGNSQIETGECYVSVGKILYEQRKYKEALDNYYKALKNNQGILDQYSLRVGEILYNIGLCFVGLSDYESAEKMFIKVNKINKSRDQEDKEEEDLEEERKVRSRIEMLSSKMLKLAKNG